VRKFKIATILYRIDGSTVALLVNKDMLGMKIPVKKSILTNVCQLLICTVKSGDQMAIFNLRLKMEM